MNVSIAYSGDDQQDWRRLTVDDGATVEEVIQHSGILSDFPDIDLKRQKIGIYGKFVKLTASLTEGDRVEIYRGITRVLDEDDDDDDD